MAEETAGGVISAPEARCRRITPFEQALMRYSSLSGNDLSPSLKAEAKAMQGAVDTTVKQSAFYFEILLKVIPALLVLFFGWLKLSGYPLVGALASLSGERILQIAMVIYFASWVFGSRFELNLQKMNYVKSPFVSRTLGALVLYFIVLGVLFGTLCWVKTLPSFARLLLLFWCINAAGFWSTNQGIKSQLVSQKTTQLSQHTAARAAELDEVEAYLVGDWQKIRFIAGGVVLILVNIVAILGFGPLTTKLTTLRMEQSSRGCYLCPSLCSWR